MLRIILGLVSVMTPLPVLFALISLLGKEGKSKLIDKLYNLRVTSGGNKAFIDYITSLLDRLDDTDILTM
jgi:hypothetical protein